MVISLFIIFYVLHLMKALRPTGSKPILPTSISEETDSSFFFIFETDTFISDNGSFVIRMADQITVSNSTINCFIQYGQFPSYHTSCNTFDGKEIAIPFGKTQTTRYTIFITGITLPRNEGALTNFKIMTCA